MSTNFFQILENDNEGTSLYINDNKALRKVAGFQDNNFKALEKISNVKINLRGNLITLKGSSERIKNVVNTIDKLLRKTVEKNNLEEEDIKSFFKFEEVKDNLDCDISIKTPKKSVFARTDSQKKYVNFLNKNNIIISLGPAGTGKTFLSVAVAVNKLVGGHVKKIILSRPAVEAGERLGFLPGDMKEKVDPYLRPLYDSLYDLLDFEKIQKKIEVGDIEIAPLAFMRGRTLKNCFAILDEAQNATDTQIKMFLTRLGENSKIVINGDPSQIDLPNKLLSGLTRSKKLLGHLKEISVVDFDHKDVVRHPLVSKIVKAYSEQKT